MFTSIQVCDLLLPQETNELPTNDRFPASETILGVDYTGPVNIIPVLGGSHQIFKGYIVLFVCFLLQQLICN